MCKNPEGRIFLRQTLQTFGEPFAVCFGLGLNRHFDNRFREGRWLEKDIEIFITQGVTSGDVSNSDQGSDVAGIGGFHLNPFVGLNH